MAADSLRRRERFWAKVDFSGEVNSHRPELGRCWIWTASIAKTGYGSFGGPGRKTVSAHRYAYQITFGEVPEGLDLDHLCRVRACVRPSHLEPVTRAVNAQRGAWGMRTHCPQGHPYDEANTYTNSAGHRWCRACRNERQKRYDSERTPEQIAARREYQTAWQRRVKEQRRAEAEAEMFPFYSARTDLRFERLAAELDLYEMRRAAQVDDELGLSDEARKAWREGA